MCGKDEFMHDVKEQESRMRDERDLDRALARVGLLQNAIRLALSDLRLPQAAGGGASQVEIRLRAALTATESRRGMS
jgi:hypothetical protein